MMVPMLNSTTTTLITITTTPTTPMLLLLLPHCYDYHFGARIHDGADAATTLHYSSYYYYISIITLGVRTHDKADASLIILDMLGYLSMHHYLY